MAYYGTQTQQQHQKQHQQAMPYGHQHQQQHQHQRSMAHQNIINMANHMRNTATNTNNTTTNNNHHNNNHTTNGQRSMAYQNIMNMGNMNRSYLRENVHPPVAIAVPVGGGGGQQAGTASGHPGASHPGGGVLVSATTTAINNYHTTKSNRTLELKVVTNDMIPRCLEKYAKDSPLMTNLKKKFVTLPREDMALLALVEVFAFQYRTKVPTLYEPDVMPNASLYYNRLRDKKSHMCARIDEVTGFRCVGCRETTINRSNGTNNNAGANGYMVGAAQLIVSADIFAASAVRQSLESLRAHMLQCKMVPLKMKQELAGHRLSGMSQPQQQRLAHPPTTTLEDYIAVWIPTLTNYFARRYGYPKIHTNKNYYNNNNNNNMHHPFQYNHRNNNNVALADLSVQHLSRGLANFQQHYGGGYQYHARASGAQSPVSVVETEDLVRWELEDCVNQGLVANNYGVASFKPRTIFGNLSELPMLVHQEVSPLLELLLQSLCAIQRWRTTRRTSATAATTTTTKTTTATKTAGTKRSNQEISSDNKTGATATAAATCATSSSGSENKNNNKRLSNVFFECSHCHQHILCASSASGRETGEFILTSFCKHLTEECEQVPQERAEKLTKMKQQMSDIQHAKQIRVIEQNWNSWKSQFPGGTNSSSGKEGSANKRLRQQSNDGADCWRPLSWKFLQDNTAACIADKTLATKGPSVYLVANDKELPFGFSSIIRTNDVLFGWNGKHLGNRRFLQELVAARAAFYEKDPTLAQQNVIACEVMREIGKRAGRFFTMPIIPPSTSIPPPLVTTTAGGTTTTTNATAAMMMPPVMIKPERAVYLILQTIRRGNSVLYQPPPDPTTNSGGRGRGGRGGSRVLECEVAPQRSLFGKEILHNKRFKKSSYLEEGDNA